MKLYKYLNDSVILIMPSVIKNKIVTHLSKSDKIYDIKYSSFNEVIKNLFFDYDEKAIYYVMKKENTNYENAIVLIDNLYYLNLDNSDAPIIDRLNNIYTYLSKEGLLKTNSLYYQHLSKKKIIIYGFNTLSKYENYIINKLKNITEVIILNEDNNNYDHNVFEFENINEEIEFVANDIISKNINLDKIFIANIKSEYLSTINRIFNFYNIPNNIGPFDYLYETKIGKDFFLNLNNVNKYIEQINDSKIKDAIISLLNKYYWIDDYNKVKDMLIAEFKKCIIPKDKFKNAVNEAEFIDGLINDDEYVYLIGFNQSFIPKIFEDTDLIYDNIKSQYLDTTFEKNKNEILKCKNKMSQIKNLTITYCKNGINNSYEYSSLIETLNMSIINKKYFYSTYSNLSNMYNLGLFLDSYYKFNFIDENMKILLPNYRNINYLKYNNQFSGLRKINFKNLNLSYSKINNFYKCHFRYYLESILKLNVDKDKFDSYVGTLCHYILKSINEIDFNFEKSFNDFLKNNYFNFNISEKYYLDKIMIELKKAVAFIIKHHEYSEFKHIENEKEIKVNFKNNVIFNGIIDKIMINKNDISIIDYKTGQINIDLSLSLYGINMQLPIYVYLIKSVYPDSNIIGLYLQRILCPKFNYDKNKDLKVLEKNHFKLSGFTIDEKNIIKSFDPTYEKSDFIKGMSITNKGFSHYAKLLSKDAFEKLENIANDKIIEAINKIEERNYVINPKIVDNENISCNYCPYNSICYVKDKDKMIIEKDKNLSFLGGDKNEQLD